MKSTSDFRAGRHVVYKLFVHLVFIPKYRRGCITGKVAEIFERSFTKVCDDFESELLECNCQLDHVHLLVAYPPKVAVSNLVNSLKGVSARRVRAAEIPEVQKVLWGKSFWSASYCAVSCGGAPLEIVRKYVEKQ